MRILFTTAAIFILNSIISAQSLSDLQKRKEDAAKEIEYTTRLLIEVQKDERTSLNRLRLITNKINQRNTIINSINEEIQVYQEFTDNNYMVIEMLNSDIEKIKDEYAQLIRSAYRNKNVNDKILFLLSADGVNQAYRRFLYLKRYTEYREKQAEVIVAIQYVLNERIKKLEQQKLTKQVLVGETEKENLQLTAEKNQHSLVYQQLKNQERNLQKKLNQQQKVERQLEKEIQRIIEEETSKNENPDVSGFELTPVEKLVDDHFALNKRKLPWPVERGVITEKFGIHQHPVLSNVFVNNNGINIATEVGATVRAIFSGEVSRVFGISGGNTAVIIRHGKYLTVYSNLSEVIVKKGETVATKQNIGTVYFDKNDENKSILKFQIWHETQKLNPEEWIVR